jgi:molybdate transport system substrate-binding protein
VFAAASLQNALTDVGAAYRRSTGREVRFSFAASSALTRQIEQGAPADLFISADTDWMDYAVQKNLVLRASRRNLLTNRLALIAPANSKIILAVGPGMPIRTALGDGRLSIAGPDVPAGKYARAAQISLGVWKEVEDRLAPADNVRAALQFVARGEAPLGVVYDTDAKVEPKVRIVGLFPASSHPQILYPAALVGNAPSAEAAQLSFAQTSSHAYSVPSDTVYTPEIASSARSVGPRSAAASSAVHRSSTWMTE